MFASVRHVRFRVQTLVLLTDKAQAKDSRLVSARIHLISTYRLCSALLVTVAFLCFTCPTLAQQSKSEQLALIQSQASHFASLAMKCIRKEYPNKPDHTINDGEDVRSPRAMHPAFYGCFDWHSTVHG